jgi:hypothetical protein
VPKKASVALQKITDFKDGFVFDRDTCDKKLLYYLDGDNYLCTFEDGYTVTNQYAVCMRNNGYVLDIKNEYCTLINMLKARKNIF